MYVEQFLHASSRIEMTSNPASRNAIFNLMLPLFNWATKEFAQSFQNVILELKEIYNLTK